MLIPKLKVCKKIWIVTLLKSIGPRFWTISKVQIDTIDCQSIHCWNNNNWILSSFMCGIHAWTNQLRDFLNAFVLLKLRHDTEQTKMTMGQYNVNNCLGIHGRRQEWSCSTYSAQTLICDLQCYTLQCFVFFIFCHNYCIFYWICSKPLSSVFLAANSAYKSLSLIFHRCIQFNLSNNINVLLPTFPFSSSFFHFPPFVFPIVPPSSFYLPSSFQL